MKTYNLIVVISQSISIIFIFQILICVAHSIKTDNILEQSFESDI